MKSLALLLLPLNIFPTQLSDTELEVLASKVKFAMREKRWHLQDEYTRDRTIYQRWQKLELFVRLSLHSCEIEEEAKERFAEDVGQVRGEYGPGNKTVKIGDEGQEWNKPKGQDALVYFRKAKVIIAVVASSIEEAREYSRSIAEVLPEKPLAEANDAEQPVAAEAVPRGSHASAIAVHGPAEPER
jgi:hypothetical protein